MNECERARKSDKSMNEEMARCKQQHQQIK